MSQNIVCFESTGTTLKMRSRNHSKSIQNQVCTQKSPFLFSEVSLDRSMAPKVLNGGAEHTKRQVAATKKEMSSPRSQLFAKKRPANSHLGTSQPTQISAGKLKAQKRQRNKEAQQRGQGYGRSFKITLNGLHWTMTEV